MGCLSWPQKKALKLAFKMIERSIDKKDSNNSGNGALLGNNGNNQMSQRNQNSSHPKMKLAMNLITKVLDL